MCFFFGRGLYFFGALLPRSWFDGAGCKGCGQAVNLDVTVAISVNYMDSTNAERVRLHRSIHRMTPKSQKHPHCASASVRTCARIDRSDRVL